MKVHEQSNDFERTDEKMTLEEQQDSILPVGTMEVNPENTALVIVDPQNDFLRDDGVAWKLVKESVEANQTIQNLELLLKAGEKNNLKLFISPHYYYPTDGDWQFGGPLENMMHKGGMFKRKDPLSLEGFEGSGADFLESLKPFIKKPETIVASPHKVYGPQNTDLVLQLRKHGISRLILAGMSANLCIESHLRDLLEQGFEVAVVSDATAAAILPGLNGDQAAKVNFRMIANAMWNTEETIKRMDGE
ncbi:cysteine hydrolase family protein [Planococcus donghaensis]|nr:cysteine hydrolase [Planococcus donghaensis]